MQEWLDLLFHGPLLFLLPTPNNSTLNAINAGMAKTRSMTRNQNHDYDASLSSSSRNTSFDKDHVGPWSDVNHDVLFLVMMQLRVVDFIAFRGVCKSWRSFAVSKSSMFLASKPPMKISINPHANNQDCYIYLKEDFEEPMFKTILPHSAGRICIGSTCGYLILFSSETRDFWLVNPITRHELHFPDFPLCVADLPTHEKEMRTIKGILVFSPSISGRVFVVLSSKLSLSFYIAGKPGWNHVSSSLPIVDVHVFKGKIYTLHSDCSLGELRLNLNSKWKGKWMLLKTKSFPKPDLYILQLVSSNEKLLVINWVSKQKIFMELDFGK
ncbi:unnamed protein product [Lactuca virosa]|uniref:F-box domain-containing protein n=1 Tax=Lactuca virosa TaxID=75947 RepID=A0AAU9PG28_9ASTR|nr:unnamed protein product [Lactuca virosa]